VVCNVREDHLQEMGPTLADVARSLSRSMPVGGVCITAEREQLAILAEEADKRSCRLVVVDPESVTDAEIAGFSYYTFKENVAVALGVAAELGIARDIAIKGMWDAAPDPGVLTVETYQVGGKLLRFANVFAANDPQSTAMNFAQLYERGAVRAPIFTLINCRPDRVERNGQMGELVPDLHTEKLFLIGHPTRSARASVPRVWRGEVFDLGGTGRPVEEIFRTIVEAIDTEASLIAIGNIHGQGEILIEHLQKAGLAC
jgi:poly-gamma-glutamate synthase PgsB/CapB